VSVVHVKILNVNVLKKCKCKIKFSCKGIQKAGNNNNCYKKFEDVLFNKC
jgi:hypothetical protein